jgi:hypothetical protein
MVNTTKREAYNLDYLEQKWKPTDIRPVPSLILFLNAR